MSNTEPVAAAVDGAARLPMPPGAGPHVTIVLATHNPPPELFVRQVESLRAQSHTHWHCVVVDDASSPESRELIREVVASDPRFNVHYASSRSGFYRNFERGLRLVPADAAFVALCDQDDVWSADKLAVLLRRFTACTTLAYCDTRLVDLDGCTLADTYWTARRNNWQDLTNLVLANTVTGAAAVFRAELLPAVLPFPPPTAASFHDHWIAVVALSAGDLAYETAALQDYVQHGANVIGHSGGRQRGSRAHRLTSPGRLWQRAERAYEEDLVRVSGMARLVLSRLEHVEGSKAKELAFLAALDRGLAPLLWMASRALASRIDSRTTLGIERRLLAAMVWVRLQRRRRAVGP